MDQQTFYLLILQNRSSFDIAAFSPITFYFNQKKSDCICKMKYFIDQTAWLLLPAAVEELGTSSRK